MNLSACSIMRIIIIFT